MSKDIEDKEFNADEWFAEEFAEEEVVASKSNEELLAEYFGNDYVDSNVIKQPPTPSDSPNAKLIELNDLLNYSEEKHLDTNFNYEWGAEYQIEEDARLKAGFKDYLNAPRISGIQYGYSDTNKIPHDKINRTDKSVQIKDIQDVELDDHDSSLLRGHYSTIILNKNEEDEIVGIDVICNCGNRTRLEFDFDGSLKTSSITGSNVIIKDPTKDPTIISDTLPLQILESPDNHIDDINYSESLIQELDSNLISGNPVFEDLTLPSLD